MMKSVIYLCFLLIFSSCGSEASSEIVSKNFDYTDFQKLDIGSAFKVTLTQGEEFIIKAAGPESSVSRILINQESDQLEIHFDKGFTINNHEIELFITLPQLRAINTSGAVSVETTNQFSSTQDMIIDLNGASKMKIDLDVPELKVDLSGASKLDVKGRADNFYLTATGASKILGLDLNTLHSIINLHGASSIELTVKDLLEINASGASSVRYKGTAKVKKSTSGASKVKRLED